MASLADAYVRIRPDTTGLDASGISKPASEMGKKAGEEAGKAFGLSFSSLLKTAAAAAAGLASGKIVEFFHSTIEAASDVSEAQNKVAVVFGKSTASVLAFGRQSATSMGLSKASYLDAVGTLGNLFVALKLPGPEAAKMSTSMVKLAGDLASFNNTSPEDALLALRSGLVGETEPLRSYGVNITAATLQTEAMKLGLIRHVKDALTPAQKATATYALILDQTKTAQGDFARTSGGLANSQRILKAQFDDLKSTIGTALLPAFTGLVHVVSNQVVPGIRNFIAGVQGKGELEGFSGKLNIAGRGVWAFFQTLKDGQVVSTGYVGDMERMAAALRETGTWINNNKDWLAAFVGTLLVAKVGIDAYIGVVRVITIATRAWAIAQAVLNGTLLLNPLGLIVIAVAGFIAAWVAAYERVKWFHDAVNFWFGHIGQLALWLWHEAIVPAFDGVKAVVQEVGSWLPPIGAFFTATFQGIIGAAMGLWHGLEAAFAGVSAAVQAVGGFFTGLWHNYIQPAFDGIVSAARTWWGGVQAIFSLVVAGVQILAAPFLWLWHSIFEPVFAILGTIVKDFYIVLYDIILLAVKVIKEDFSNAINAFKVLWSAVWGAIRDFAQTWWNGVKAIWDAMIGYLSGPFNTALHAVQTAWTAVWDFIKGSVQTWWGFVRSIWELVVQYLGGPFTSALHAIQSVWDTIWNAIRSTMTTVWGNIKSIWDTMANVVTQTLPNAFRAGVDAISNFWNGLQAKVKAPINFVIGFINRGIIGPINDLVGTFGGTKLSQIPGLASGGLIRGPGTGTSDSILGLSAGGMPTARVSNGEFVVNAAQTAKHIELLRAINTPGFAGGGIIGTITGSIGDALDALTNPVKWLLDKAGDVGGLITQMGNTGFAHTLAGIPRKLIDWAAAWLKDKFGSILASAGGGPASLGGPGGDSVAAILAIARRFDPTATVSSGYRPGANDYHGQGLAADIIGANMDRIAEGFYSISGRLLELIHSPSWFVKNGVRVGPDFYASVFAEHFNHVHVAAYANALGFADGGVINEPIWGVGKSGRRYTFGERGPETVTPGVGGPGAGVNLTINVHGDVGDAQVRAIKSHVDDAFRSLAVQMKTGRRR